MILLGIDPGTTRAGYGLIQKNNSSYKILAKGLLSCSAPRQADRLAFILNSVTKLITEYRPDRAAVEKLFFTKNTTTGLAVAEARGVIMAVLAREQIPTLELTPNEIKNFLVGNGRADKKEVAKVVNLILKTKLSELDDITDALALAILADNQSLYV